MTRRAAVVRETRWVYTLIQLVLLGALVATGAILSCSPAGVFFAVGGYLAYAFGSRALLTGDHRRGIRLFRNHQYAEALPHFEQSQAFFERNAWVDRYRVLVILSPSAASYHEMSLLNQAACLIHLRRGAE